MNISYKKDLQSEYLVVETDLLNDEELYDQHILENNTIDGLVACQVRSMNVKRQIFYDIYGLKSIEELFGRNEKDFFHMYELLISLQKCIKNLDEYLLEKDDLYLDEHFIYYDNVVDSYKFVYVPQYGKCLEDQMKDLLSWMMKHIDYGIKQEVNLLYSLFSKLEKGENIFSLLNEYEEDEIERKPEISNVSGKELLNESDSCSTIEDKQEITKIYKKDDSNIYQKSNLFLVFAIIAAITGMLSIIYKEGLSFWLQNNLSIHILPSFVSSAIFILSAVCIFVYFIIIHKNKTHTNSESDDFWKEEQMIDVSSISLKETTVLNEPITEYETQLLCPCGKLILKARLGVREIEVNVFPYTIGSNPSIAQYSINSNVISRRHALITRDKGKFYIEDLHSTNGTWINGMKMLPNHPSELHHGDQITFADVEFDIIISEF